MNNQLDIINEQDEVVGQDDVEEIHQKDLLHRSIHILIVDPQGRFYLRQRSSKKSRYPGWYTNSVGAHVPAGQSYDETTRESLKETLGLDCKLKFLGKVRVHDKYENEISWTYVGYVDDLDKIKANSEEPGRFFRTDEIKNLKKKYKITPYVFKSLDLYLKLKEDDK